MELIELFATPVWVGELDNIDNKKLEDYCNLLRQRNPEKRDANKYRKNPTGLKWRSWYLVKEEYDECQELYNLTNSISYNVNECFKTFNPNKTVNLVLSNSWINIISPGEYVAPHVHPASCLLVTYYVKTPNRCGNIVFINSNYTITWNYPTGLYAERSKYTDQMRSIEVSAGGYVIAPAHAQHYVEPNDSDEDRISIVLNYTIKDSNPYLTNDRNYAKRKSVIGLSND